MIHKSFYSDILKQDFVLKITTRGVRTIYKHGSLDNYVLTTRMASLTDSALKIRAKLKKAVKKAEASTTSTKN
jgi:ribosomal protein L28